MANLKSTKKQIRKTARQYIHNKVNKSALRTQIKRYLKAIEQKDVETAKLELVRTISALDKVGRKNIFHKNNTNRKKAQLQLKLNALVAAPAAAPSQALTYSRR